MKKSRFWPTELLKTFFFFPQKYAYILFSSNLKSVWYEISLDYFHNDKNDKLINSYFLKSTNYTHGSPKILQVIIPICILKCLAGSIMLMETSVI